MKDFSGNADMVDAAPRMRWLCRRGMKELDLLLLHYLDTRYAEAPDTERSAFRELLDMDDPVLWSWLIGVQPLPEGDLRSLIERLRAYR